MLFLLALIGCNQSEPTVVICHNHNDSGKDVSFLTHSPTSFWQTVIKEEGLKDSLISGGGKNTHYAKQKTCSLLVNGDSLLRDNLIIKYKAYLRSELEKYGATNTDFLTKSKKGDIFIKPNNTGFVCSYEHADNGVAGIVIVNSRVNKQIEIRVIIYEHKIPSRKITPIVKQQNMNN